MKLSKKLLYQIWIILLLIFMVIYFFDASVVSLELVLVFLVFWSMIWFLINFKK